MALSDFVRERGESCSKSTEVPTTQLLGSLFHFRFHRGRDYAKDCCLWSQRGAAAAGPLGAAGVRGSLRGALPGALKRVKDGERVRGLEQLDAAVDLVESHDLQLLLDLHGGPGGESGDRPCGRVDPNWSWEKWRVDEV